VQPLLFEPCKQGPPPEVRGTFGHPGLLRNTATGPRQTHRRFVSNNRKFFGDTDGPPANMLQRILIAGRLLALPNIAARDTGIAVVFEQGFVQQQSEPLLQVQAGTGHWPAAQTIGSDDRRAPSFASAVRPRALVQSATDTRFDLFQITTSR